MPTGGRLPSECSRMISVFVRWHLPGRGRVEMCALAGTALDQSGQPSERFDRVLFVGSAAVHGHRGFECVGNDLGNLFKAHTGSIPLDGFPPPPKLAQSAPPARFEPSLLIRRATPNPMPFDHS